VVKRPSIWPCIEIRDAPASSLDLVVEQDRELLPTFAGEL
jgi:hypothetical protein